MTHRQMHELMGKIMEQVVTIRDEGQKEYAHDKDDVFANFSRVGNLLEIDKKKVLMTYMLKHVDGIAAYVKGHKSQREDVTGRITDCMVYLMLLWGMIEEENGLLLRQKNDPPLYDVAESYTWTDRGVPIKERRVPSDGIQSNDYMQEMRKERNGIKKPEKVERSA